MNLSQLLKAVDSGQHSFKADGTSLQQLEAFQPLAQLIIEACSAGYIDADVHKESYSAHRLYDSALVRGITELGKQRLGEG